jgi:hypothetical protein
MFEKRVELTMIWIIVFAVLIGVSKYEINRQHRIIALEGKLSQFAAAWMNCSERPFTHHVYINRWDYVEVKCNPVYPNPKGLGRRLSAEIGRRTAR